MGVWVCCVRGMEGNRSKSRIKFRLNKCMALNPVLFAVLMVKQIIPLHRVGDADSRPSQGKCTCRMESPSLEVPRKSLDVPRNGAWGRVWC